MTERKRERVREREREIEPKRESETKDKTWQLTMGSRTSGDHVCLRLSANDGLPEPSTIS